jgi:hypothetical protein
MLRDESGLDNRPGHVKRFLSRCVGLASELL